MLSVYKNRNLHNTSKKKKKIFGQQKQVNASDIEIKVFLAFYTKMWDCYT